MIPIDQFFFQILFGVFIIFIFHNLRSDVDDVTPSLPTWERGEGNLSSTALDLGVTWCLQPSGEDLGCGMDRYHTTATPWALLLEKDQVIQFTRGVLDLLQ